MRDCARRLVLALTAALLLMAGAAGPASAHAFLASSNPAQGSVLPTSPPLLTLHFSEPVALPLSAVTILDAVGTNVATGKLIQPLNVGADLAIAVKPDLPDGTYLVVWRVVSADSHPTSASFSFSVGKAGAVADGAPLTPDPKVGAVLGFVRLLGFVGVAAFFGGVAFLLTCWPAGRSSTIAGRTLQVGWFLAFLGALVSLLLEGPYGVGLSLSHAFDESLLRGVLETRYGQALLARVVLLVLAGAAGWLVLRRTSWATVAGFGAVALGTLVTFPYTGHPSVGSQVPLAVTSDVLHLTAMCLWFGGLLQLAVVILPDEDEHTVRAAAARFSRIAMTSVAVLVATGLYQAWREAGVLGSLTATHYGHLLLLKTGIVAAVLVVAESSRRWVGSGRTSVRGLGVSVSLETAMVVVVLAVTSLLVSGVPARTDYRPSSDLHLVAGPVHLELSVDPSATRVLDVRVDTTNAAGQPLDVQELTLTMNLAKPVAGPLNVKLAPIGQTQFQASDVELPYAGHWSVTLVARTSATREWTGTTTLQVR